MKLKSFGSETLPVFWAVLTVVVIVFGKNAQAVDGEVAAVRVILVLDRSGSMCDIASLTTICCAEGDGSGYCMNNDVTNMRVVAAHQFLDSLKVKSPNSQVGVIRYWQREETYGLYSLDFDEYLTLIHYWIDQASCENTNVSRISGGDTYIGNALKSGLELADKDYDSMDPLMKRHIILLTDGAWDDIRINDPDTIIAKYKQEYPDRAVPVVHGVFLTDSALHVAHEYPSQGCSDDIVVNPKVLQHVVALTGGTYISGSTPQSIVDNFMTLFESITGTAPGYQGDSYTIRGTSGRFSLDIHQLSGNNRSAELHLSLSRPEQVHVSIHTLSGTLIAPPVNRYLLKSTHRLTYTTGNLSNGCYLVRCTTGAETVTQLLRILQ